MELYSTLDAWLILVLALIIIAFTVASITFTITMTSIFESVRDSISKVHPKLDELIHCPYCLGHYISFLLILYTGFRIPIFNIYFLDCIMTVFPIMALVAILHKPILMAYEPVAKMKLLKERQKHLQQKD